MHIELDSRSPVYIQVINYFKQQIASGMLEAGEEIPSRRELANTLKINPNTVQRAYKVMEEQALIRTEGNMPSKVTSDYAVIRKVRTELLDQALEGFIISVKSLDIPLNELIDLVKKRYKEVTQ